MTKSSSQTTSDDEKPLIRTEARTYDKIYRIIHNVIIILQPIFFILLLLPWGYARESGEAVNGYQLGRFSYMIPSAFFIFVSAISLRQDKPRISYTCFNLSLYLILLLNIIHDSFNKICTTDVCLTDNIATSTLAGHLSFIFYIIEFWLIVGTIFMAIKYKKRQQQQSRDMGLS